MGSFATWWVGAVILALLGLGVGMVIGTMHVGTVETTETIMTTYTTVGVTQQFTGIDKAMVTWVNNLVLAIILLVITLIVSRYLASGLLFVQMVLIGIVFGGHIGEYGIVPVIMYILPHGLVEIGIYGYVIAVGAQIDRNVAQFINTVEEIYLVRRIRAIRELLHTHLFNLDRIILALLFLVFAAYIEVFISPTILLWWIGITQNVN
jgi:hypothetical protein